MNRVQVVGGGHGGVAYSKARVIPWKKRIEAETYKQRGGGFDFGPGGWFDTVGNQRGGGWFDGLSRSMFGIEQTRGKKRKKPVRKQKGGSRFNERKRPVRKQFGGGWFDDLSQGMFGVKRTRRKRKRKPAVIHSATKKGGANQRGGANPFKGFFENPFRVREKLGRGKKPKPRKRE
jgi:hypothetical protein